MDLQDILKNSMAILTFLAVAEIKRKLSNMENRVNHIYNCCVESEEDD